jgi:LysM repeat protein
MQDMRQDDMQDVMEEIAEDLRYGPGKDFEKRRNSPAYAHMPVKFFIWSSVAALVLIFLLFFLFRPSDAIRSEDLKTIEGRIEQLQGEMKALKANLSGLPGIQEQTQNLETSFKRIKKNESVFLDRLKELEEGVARLEGKMANLVKESDSSTKVPEGARADGKRQYHEVKPKETLYRIAKKYGVTVNDLRRLNNLPPNKPIHPGQKLVVSSGG